MRQTLRPILSLLLALLSATEAEAQRSSEVTRTPTTIQRRAAVLTSQTELARRAGREDTAGISATNRDAFLAIASARRLPTQQPTVQPSAADLAKLLYATNARLETAIPVSPTLNLVWLAPDSTASSRRELPFRVYGLHPRTKELMSLIPILDDRGGMRYRSSASGYTAEMLVGFRDSLRPDGAVTLDHPLRIVVGGTIESVEPTRIDIRRINQVTTSIRLFSGRRPDDALLRLHPDFSAVALEIPVPVLVDSLDVSAPARMRGFGTEERDIIVGVPSGSLAPGDSLEVTLVAEKGAISPSHRVYVKPNASASVKLRSSGLGRENLQVRSGVMAARPIEVTYTAPWLLLAIAVAGAVVGAFIRWRSASADGSPQAFPWHRALISVVLVAGVSAGLDVIGRAYYVFLSEVGTFVLAAIVAGGKSLLEWRDTGSVDQGKPA